MQIIEHFALAHAEKHTVVIHEEGLVCERDLVWQYKFLRNKNGSEFADLLLKTKNQGIWRITGLKKSDAKNMLNKTVYVGSIIDGELAANTLKKSN